MAVGGRTKATPPNSVKLEKNDILSLWCSMEGTQTQSAFNNLDTYYDYYATCEVTVSKLFFGVAHSTEASLPQPQPAAPSLVKEHEGEPDGVVMHSLSL